MTSNYRMLFSKYFTAANSRTQKAHKHGASQKSPCEIFIYMIHFTKDLLNICMRCSCEKNRIAKWNYMNATNMHTCLPSGLQLTAYMLPSCPSSPDNSPIFSPVFPSYISPFLFELTVMNLLPQGEYLTQLTKFEWSL